MSIEGRVDSTSDDRTANNAVRHQYRVLTDIEKDMVLRFKDMGADFIKLLHMVDGSEVMGDQMRARDLELARTHMEDAVMRAVRHLTK